MTQVVMPQLMGSINSMISSNSEGTKNLSTRSDFGDCLNNNLKAESSGNLSAEEKYTKYNDEKKDKSNIQNSSKVSKQVNINQNIEKLKKTKSEEIKEDKNNVKVYHTNSRGKTGKINDALTSKIASIVEESLNIDEEELNNFLEMFGYQMIDLMNPDNLRNIVLAAHGETDITVALTNEDLAIKLGDILQAVSDLKLEDFGVSKEELINMLEDQSKSSVNMENSHIYGEKISDSNENVKRNKPNNDEHVQEELDISQTTDKPVDNITLTLDKHMSNSNGNNTSYNQQSGTNGQTSSQMGATVQSETNEQPMNEESENADSTMEKQLNQIINNLSNATIKNVDGTQQQIIEVTQMREIVSQVVKEIRIQIEPGTTSMELQLNPENLGKVNLSVISKEGILTAQFMVQNSATKEVIESQLQLLKDNLNDQGVKVEAIEVTVSNFSFAESNGAGQGTMEQKSTPRNLNLQEVEEFIDLSKDDAIVADMMQLNGNMVDFTA